MKNKKIKMRRLQVKKLAEVKNLVEAEVKNLKEKAVKEQQQLRRERKIKTIE